MRKTSNNKEQMTQAIKSNSFKSNKGITLVALVITKLVPTA